METNQNPFIFPLRLRAHFFPFFCLLTLLPSSSSPPGGRLDVHAALRCSPSRGPPIYRADRCRYSFPLWPAAAGERSVVEPAVPVAPPAFRCHMPKHQRIRRHVLSVLAERRSTHPSGWNVNPALLLKPTHAALQLQVSCLPSSADRLSPSLIMQLLHVLLWPLTPGETVNKWHQRHPNGGTRPRRCLGDVMSRLAMSARPRRAAVTSLCRSDDGMGRAADD